MGPALLGASCERRTVSTRQQQTSGERPAAQRAGAPLLAALPSRDTHLLGAGLDTETPVSMLRDREDWGWLYGDTLREPGCGASHRGSQEDAWTHQKTKVPLLGSVEGNVCNCHGSFFFKAGHHLPSST